MKKHLFGFAIFSFIFASFAVAFAYFYAPPIPQISVIEENEPFQLITESVEKTSCFGVTKKDISYQIQYTQYDSDNDQFISKMYVTWKGNGEAPKKLFVATKIYTLEQRKFAEHFSSMVFTEPFENSKTAMLIVKFKIPENLFDKKQNLYATFNFSESSNDEYEFSSGTTTESQSVLYFHR